MNAQHSPANGTHTTNGRPNGYSTITPFLALDDPKSALDFYREVFEASVVSSQEVGGQITHAELQMPSGRLQLGLAKDNYKLRAPNPSDDYAQFSLTIYVRDVDEVVAAAVARGAVVREELATFVSGDRYANLKDPFGIRWSVMTRIEDLSDEESATRVGLWLAEMSQQEPDNV